MKIKKITTAGLLIAVGVLLPQLFHVFGQQAGQIFLPMHICVLIGGLFIGPFYGLAIGLITPLISFLITGMPPVPILIFMIFELAAYGLTSGFFVKKFNIYISLILAQISGRLFYAFTLFVAANLMHLNVPPVITFLTATITGIPGIIIQLILVPFVVMALKKWRKA